jgi:hypothetical protein
MADPGQPQPAAAPKGKFCFLVTATYGSPRAPQVAWLQKMRDALLQHSLLGQELYEHSHAEYYRFSPTVAKHMNVLPALKSALRSLAVEPILDFFMLVEEFVGGGWRRDIQSSGELMIAGNVSDRHTAELAMKSAGQMKSRLDSRSDRWQAQPPPPVPESTDPETVFTYLTEVVECLAPSTEYTSWALLTPLVTYWQAVYQAQVGGPQTDWTIAINGWLSGFPIPPVFSHLNKESAEQELSLLAKTLFPVPSVRHQIGRRLVDSYISFLSYDLIETLQEIDYLPSH